MVVQPRGDVFRCFTQDAHASLSGEAAARWSTAARPFVSPRLAAAIRHHDIGWLAADAAPAFDPSRGRPFDFQTLPVEERVAIYTAGIDTLEALDPLAGLLASLHFSGFVDHQRFAAFHAREEARRAALGAAIAGDAEAVEDTAAYGLLQQLDLLSLVVCLAQPGSTPADHPRWLRHSLVVDGTRHEVDLADAWSVVVRPFPFAAPFGAAVAYRDLRREACATAQSMLDAWDAAPQEVGEFRFGPV